MLLCDECEWERECVDVCVWLCVGCAACVATPRALPVPEWRGVDEAVTVVALLVRGLCGVCVVCVSVCVMCVVCDSVCDVGCVGCVDALCVFVVCVPRTEDEDALSITREND